MFTGCCELKLTKLWVLVIPLVTFVVPLILRVQKGNLTIPGDYSYYYLSQETFRFFGDSLLTYWVISLALAVILVVLYSRLIYLNFKDDLAVILSVFMFTLSPVTIYLSS